MQADIFERTHSSSLGMGLQGVEARAARLGGRRRKKDARVSWCRGLDTGGSKLDRKTGISFELPAGLQWNVLRIQP